MSSDQRSCSHVLTPSSHRRRYCYYYYCCIFQQTRDIRSNTARNRCGSSFYWRGPRDYSRRTQQNQSYLPLSPPCGASSFRGSIDLRGDSRSCSKRPRQSEHGEVEHDKLSIAPVDARAAQAVRQPPDPQDRRATWCRLRRAWGFVAVSGLRA